MNVAVGLRNSCCPMSQSKQDMSSLLCNITKGSYNKTAKTIEPKFNIDVAHLPGQQIDLLTVCILVSFCIAHFQVSDYQKVITVCHIVKFNLIVVIIVVITTKTHT